MTYREKEKERKHYVTQRRWLNSWYLGNVVANTDQHRDQKHRDLNKQNRKNVSHNMEERIRMERCDSYWERERKDVAGTN